jgi:hypothetical protein
VVKAQKGEHGRYMGFLKAATDIQRTSGTLTNAAATGVLFRANSLCHQQLFLTFFVSSQIFLLAFLRLLSELSVSSPCHTLRKGEPTTAFLSTDTVSIRAVTQSWFISNTQTHEQGRQHTQKPPDSEQVTSLSTHGKFRALHLTPLLLLWKVYHHGISMQELHLSAQIHSYLC